VSFVVQNSRISRGRVDGELMDGAALRGGVLDLMENSLQWRGGERTGCVIGGEVIATNDIGSSWICVAVAVVTRGRSYWLHR